MGSSTDEGYIVMKIFFKFRRIVVELHRDCENAIGEVGTRFGESEMDGSVEDGGVGD